MGEDDAHIEGRVDSLFESMKERFVDIESKSIEGMKEIPIGERSMCTVHRVIYEEREAKDNPYDPKEISIGPFHWNNEQLKKEDLKWQYVYSLAKGSGEVLREFIDVACRREREVRDCYHELGDIGSDDLVNMLVLDGCFLIKFFLLKEELIEDFGWRLPRIMHDILLLENQVPFFVLEELFKVCKRSFAEDYITIASMLDIAVDYLFHTELQRNLGACSIHYSMFSIHPSHILHLYHTLVVSSSMGAYFHDSIMLFTAKRFFSVLSSLASLPICFIRNLLYTNPPYQTKILTATDLQHAGVQLQGSFMDLRFEKGTLYIPFFTLDRQGFSLLKNLIALEIYHPGPIPPYMLTYAEFLGELIKTPADMKVVQEKNIINAHSNEEGARLIGKLLTRVIELEDAQVPRFRNLVHWQRPNKRSKELMDYCKEPHHRWRAQLKSDYCGNPWSIMGLLVASSFLVLTLAQTVFAVLSYMAEK